MNVQIKSGEKLTQTIYLPSIILIKARVLFNSFMKVHVSGVDVSASGLST